MDLLPEKSSKLATESLNSAPYLRAVIKEAMRMHAAVNGVTRAAQQDLVLQGFQIPKDVKIVKPPDFASNFVSFRPM